jgi:hypothetical protein
MNGRGRREALTSAKIDSGEFVCSGVLEQFRRCFLFTVTVSNTLSIGSSIYGRAQSVLTTTRRRSKEGHRLF